MQSGTEAEQEGHLRVALPSSTKPRRMSSNKARLSAIGLSRQGLGSRIFLYNANTSLSNCSSIVNVQNYCYGVRLGITFKCIVQQVILTLANAQGVTCNKKLL